MSVEIKTLKEIQPSSLTFICGLPGIAYIGKLSVDYLIQQLKAELIGEVYSKYFPPYIMIKEDGLAELFKDELYWLKGEGGKDIVFLTGNSQALSPEGQYEVANTILDWAVNHKTTRVFSVAALVTDRPFETPNVYCTASTATLLEEAQKHGAQKLDHGIIGGENGLIMGLAKNKQDIESACLLDETHGYQTSMGEYLFDAKAAKAALKVLTSMLNLKVNMEAIDKQAVQMDELIAKMTEIERNVAEEMKKSTKRPSYVT